MPVLRLDLRCDVLPPELSRLVVLAVGGFCPECWAIMLGCGPVVDSSHIAGLWACGRHSLGCGPVVDCAHCWAVGLWWTLATLLGCGPVVDSSHIAGLWACGGL